MRYLLLAVLLVLIVAGCSSQNPETDSPYLTGTEGVVLQNVYTPSKVYEDEEFEVTYEFENRGAYAINDMDPGVFIISYDKLYLEFVDSLSRYGGDYFTLAPRTRYQDGERSFITLFFRARELQRASEQASTKILLTLCYPYATNVTSQVCLEQDRRVDPGAVACKSGTIRPLSPAAPIGIKDIEVRSRRVSTITGEAGVAPQFRITLQNYGDGMPAMGACDDQAAVLAAARVRAWLLDQPLDCGDGLARFSRNEAFISCSVPEDEALTFASGNFISLLTVEAAYSYRDGESTEVVILRE